LIGFYTLSACHLLRPATEQNSRSCPHKRLKQGWEVAARIDCEPPGHTPVYMTKKLVRAYPRETQEMVFDAHNRAFAFFKGACTRGIYDNMKTAVEAVFIGKDRQFNRRFLRMCGHYLIEPTACTPASGWEKGQVENQVGAVPRCRQPTSPPRHRSRLPSQHHCNQNASSSIGALLRYCARASIGLAAVVPLILGSPSLFDRVKRLQKSPD
jgi:hypothetical protein